MMAPAAIGEPTSRVDAHAKVTGEARYGSDFYGGRNPAYACLRTSAIARGRITAIEEREARAVPGVLEIFTYRNVGNRIKPGNIVSQNGYMGTSIAPLASEQIYHDGQIIAVVVADTFEAANEGANRLTVAYEGEAPSAGFDSPGLQTTAGGEEDPSVGDAAGAFADAPVKVDEHYETATQHHNPIELFTTTAAWSNDKLTVWESSQNMYGFQNGLAEQLGLRPSDIHVLSPFVGGAFGSRGSLTQRTALICHAARVLNRPVTLEATRRDGFTIATYRAETRHHIKLAATKDGRLVSLTHEGWEISSRPDNYKVAGTDASTRLYTCQNIASKVTVLHADRDTPGFMRSPPETPYLFALESAIDELAYALGMDPIELRRVNDTKKEPIRGLPYTSRSLMPCFDAAAQSFGWSRRNSAPGSMRSGDWLNWLGLCRDDVPDADGAGHGASDAHAASVRQSPDRGARYRHRRLHRFRSDCG
jgi:xanthine dehydrogenase YagR molybdenum-binding subunit